MVWKGTPESFSSDLLAPHGGPGPTEPPVGARQGGWRLRAGGAGTGR